MQLMLSLGICLSLLGIYGVTGQFVQVQHASLTQNASALCTRNGTRYCLMFDLNQNADNIDIVFARNISDPSGMSNSVGTLDSAGNGILIDNSTGSNVYWLSIYWTWPPTVLEQSAIDAFAVVDADVVRVHIMAKSLWVAPYLDWVTFADDVLYTAECNSSEIQDNIITSGVISVLGAIDETAEAFTLSSELTVHLTSDDSLAVAPFLGDDIYLKVALTSPVGGSMAATGVYVFDCWVCDAADCLGLITKPIMDSSGCSSLSPYIVNFMDILGVTRTNDFGAFQLNVGAPWDMYFQCSVGYCFDVTDQRCVDYCANPTPAGKRKRRQADETDPIGIERISVHITVQSGTRPLSETKDGISLVDNDPTPVKETETVGLIAAVVVLAGLLLVGLIVAVAVFFHLSRRIRVNEKTMN